MSLMPETHLDLLTRPVTVSLVTVMPSGQPQATPVWCDFEEGHVLINTAVGRQKDKNLSTMPYVSVLAIDPDNPYRWMEIRGKVVERILDGAVDHIEKQSWKYRNKKFYGDNVAAELANTQTRVIYKIQPEKFNESEGQLRHPATLPPAPPNPNPVIPDEFAHLLTDPIVVTVATVLPNGKPQATPVWCNYQDGLIWLNTAEGRQKDKNLQRDPKVTILSVNPTHDGEWLEVRGKVIERTTEGAEAHIDLLCQQYAGIEKYFGGFHPTATNQSMTRVIYKIQPEKVNIDR